MNNLRAVVHAFSSTVNVYFLFLTVEFAITYSAFLKQQGSSARILQESMALMRTAKDFNLI